MVALVFLFGVTRMPAAGVRSYHSMHSCTRAQNASFHCAWLHLAVILENQKARSKVVILAGLRAT